MEKLFPPTLLSVLPQRIYSRLSGSLHQRRGEKLTEAHYIGFCTHASTPSALRTKTCAHQRQILKEEWRTISNFRDPHFCTRRERGNNVYGVAVVSLFPRCSVPRQTKTASMCRFEMHLPANKKSQRLRKSHNHFVAQTPSIVDSVDVSFCI